MIIIKKQRLFIITICWVLTLPFMQACYANVDSDNNEASQLRSLSMHQQSSASIPISTIDSNTEYPSFFEKSFNAVYQFVSEHEYLFVPLSGAIVGGTICSPWCVVVGGVAGAADEVLIYLGFTDKRYLVWGIVGTATGNILAPLSSMSKLGGFAIGILLPTDIYNNHPEFIVPAVSIIVGGDLTWVLCNIIDNAIGDKHSIILFVAGNKVTTNLLNGLLNPIVSNAVGAVLGSIAACYEEEIVATFLAPAIAPIKTSRDLYDIYGKFIPKEQLSKNIERQALALIGNRFMIQFLIKKLDAHIADLSLHFGRLNVPNNPAWGNFRTELGNVAIFVFPYLIGNAISNRIDNYFSKNLQYTLEDKIRFEFFSDETTSYLPNDPTTKVLTDNLKGDLYAITKSGSKLITGGVSAFIGGVHGIGVMVVASPNILVYSFFYNQAKSIISNYIAKQEGFFEEKLKVLDANIGGIMQYDANNIRTITERDGLAATKMRLQQLYDTSREHETNKERWGDISQLWERLSMVTNFLVDYHLVGKELNQGKLPFDSRSTVLNAGGKIAYLLSWPGNNAKELVSIGQSLDRVIILEGKIHAQSKHLDRINRTFKDENKLIIQSLAIGVEGDVLVSAEDLMLEIGKVYVLDGKPGCGKSLFLSKIKGVKTNNVSGKGDIYYPLVNGKEPKIIMVSQKNYFPSNSSLQEIISWPNGISSDPTLNSAQKKEIQSFLKEIKLWEAVDIDDNDIDLDGVKDWPNILSGGEQKKIMIVAAIIKKPDILILDEVFAGLGSEATIIAQQMLKKYLPPHVLILVVDHDVQTNNYNHFYDKKLNFFDKSIVFQDC